jgi:2-keto-3-deoxy-L-rhamnonate aldolase RhmA
MIVNIESAAALEALDQILDVPDLDALLIGPHDLSLNLGIPEQYAHPKFKQAVSTIIRKARAKNVGVGLHFSFGIDAEIEWAKEGANFIVHSSDFFLTRDALAEDLQKFKRELGERCETQPKPAPEEAI